MCPCCGSRRSARLARRRVAASPLAPVLAPPRYYYLRTGVVPQGPVELITLRAMVIEGRLDGSAWVSAAGRDDWRPASDVLDNETTTAALLPLSDP